jgi:hypothetical protein
VGKFLRGRRLLFHAVKTLSQKPDRIHRIFRMDRIGSRVVIQSLKRILSILKIL